MYKIHTLEGWVGVGSGTVDPVKKIESEGAQPNIFAFFINRDVVVDYMATAKTGSFYLTETVILPNASPDGTRVQGNIDLGAYVNVATGQAIAVESVDFIIQSGGGNNLRIQTFATADAAIGFQVSDLNPGNLYLRADNQSLVASGAMNIDYTNNQGTHTADLYPDNFGPAALSEAFLVVNDTLYLTAGIDLSGTVGVQDLSITARIKCRVVKLSTKDWMAIAIQSTASDN